MNTLPKYITLDEFMKDAEPTTLQEDIIKQHEKSEDYLRPVPFSKTEIGEQASKWSKLLKVYL